MATLICDPWLRWKEENRESHFPSQSLLSACVKGKTWQQTNMKAEHTVTDPRRKGRQVPAGQLQMEGRAHARRFVCRSSSAPPDKHWAGWQVGVGKKASPMKVVLPLPASKFFKRRNLEESAVLDRATLHSDQYTKTGAFQSRVLQHISHNLRHCLKWTVLIAMPACPPHHHTQTGPETVKLNNPRKGRRLVVWKNSWCSLIP